MKKAKRIRGIIKKKTGAMLLYVMLIPTFIDTAISLFSGRYIEFLLKSAGFALMAISAILVSRGIGESVDYEEATVAKAPLPYKSAGAVSLSLSVFIFGFLVAHRGLFETIFVSLLAGIGVLMYYGKDINRDKIPQDLDINPDILIKSLNEAKQKIASIKSHSVEIKDISLKSAVDRAIQRADDIIELIESNPSAIRMARKFLIVYVNGMEEVLKSYSQLDTDTIDKDTQERLKSLLIEAEARFDKELERLKSDDKFDLDVQIDALREQIKNH